MWIAFLVDSLDLAAGFDEREDDEEPFPSAKNFSLALALKPLSVDVVDELRREEVSVCVSLVVVEVEFLGLEVALDIVVVAVFEGILILALGELSTGRE